MTAVEMPLNTAIPARRGKRAKLNVVPWLYLLPALATFVIWIYEPLARAVYLSVFEWNMLPNAPMKFVGAHNYENLYQP
jgi:multiple sugar transport system permease protein